MTAHLCPIVQKDLRHGEDEIARIFAALNHEHVDPRIALAVELGAEARLGQVRRLRRTDINLSPVGAFGFGRVVVQGSGKKTGVMRDLTPEERAAIDRAPEGYLFDLEREFPGGRAHGLLRLPAGRLPYDVPQSRRPRRGAAALMPSVRRAGTDLPDKPINKRTLTDMFHALETVAEVVPVEGRGWYGIRRKATDVYEDYESDERVLNSATGHTSSDTRRKKYPPRNGDVILAKTAVTRRRVRGCLRARHRWRRLAGGRILRMWTSVPQGGHAQQRVAGAHLGGTGFSCSSMRPGATKTAAFMILRMRSGCTPGEWGACTLGSAEGA